MKIMAGNSNLPLAEAISDLLQSGLLQSNIRKFNDGEVRVDILDSVRGEDIFIIQSTSNPANDHLMELLICLDGLKRASSKRITAVIPYFGYARQDRKSNSRTPISAKLVADLLTVAGCDRVLTLDLHAEQIQGFFDMPVDNLFAAPVFVKDIKNNFKLDELVIVSPDVGGVVRARHIAQALGCSLAIVDKRREKPGQSEVMNIIGEVGEKNCILVDDIIDSGGTLCNAATALLKQNAKAVYAYVTHPVLSGKAVDLIIKSDISELVVTDTINLNSQKYIEKIRVITIANLMAEAIKRIAFEKSMSDLFA